MTLTRILFVTLFVLITKDSANGQDLLTVAERSSFQATAPYADVMEFCETIAKQSPFVSLSTMGQTHEKRDIPLLIIADPPVANATDAAKDKRPVVFVMANIHAGEVCGKEALLMLARDLVNPETNDKDLFQNLILVFAPIYNADGNERFSTTNRPGQIGPAQGMGQRPNAMGLDLNRDHMKLESPEAQSLAKFMTQWQPIVAIDCHTTDGSFHRFHLTYDTPRHPATDPDLQSFARDKFLPAISQRMKQDDKFLSFYYGNFSRDHSQWLSYPAAPRYSTHYFGLRNCVGVLSEAYAFISFKQRVLVTYAFVKRTLQETSANRRAITELVTAAKQRAVKPGSTAVQFTSAELGEEWNIPGWKETTARRGRPATQDDEQTDYSVKYLGRSPATLQVKRPQGYLVPSSETRVIENLKHHGVQLETLADSKTMTIENYTIKSFRRAEREFQGHKMLSEVDVEVSPPAEATIPAGTIYVPVTQPLARLIVNLLEPQSSDGYCVWNFCDAAVEKRSWPIQRVANLRRD